MNKLNIFIDQIPNIKHWFIKFIDAKKSYKHIMHLCSTESDILPIKNNIKLLKGASCLAVLVIF